MERVTTLTAILSLLLVTLQMSLTEQSQRPIFHDSQEAVALSDRPPFSRLAIVAFAAGLLSLFAAFSIIIIPLAILSLGLCVVVVWKLTRDTAVGGRWLAQLGLGMSALAIVWSVSARVGTERYLYELAGQHAKTFLDTLSAGKIYEALELKQPEVRRQLTGTNLEEHYKALPEQERHGVDEFLSDKATTAVIAAGPQADWQFERGAGVIQRENQTYVTVDMVNSSAAGKPQRIRVQMLRQTEMLTDPDKRDSTAMWNFQGLSKVP